MLMKYLSEYHPWRIRSTSSLNTAGGSRRRNAWRVDHDVVDALAGGAGAAFAGGLESRVWLLLYAHVVAVSVRGGLFYAMAMGILDAVIVSVLAALSDQPLGSLHAVALL